MINYVKYIIFNFIIKMKFSEAELKAIVDYK